MARREVILEHSITYALLGICDAMLGATQAPINRLGDSMSTSGGQIVVDALRECGVNLVLGIPGTHNIELWDVLADAEDIKSYLVTDEQCASFMADGAASSGGGMACINIVPAAGLTHAMSGIAEAYLDQVPLLVLSCGVRRDKPFAYQLHDVDQAAMAKPVCKKVYVPLTHAELARDLREACVIARESPPGPVMVEVPVNLYLFPGDAGEVKPVSAVVPTNPAQDKISAAASILATSRNIGIYVGQGAIGARDLLIDLAERLDAIVYTTITGKGVFPETHPRFGWPVLGAGSPPQLQKIEKEFDLLIAIGCRFGEVATASYGVAPPKNFIHIDIDETVFDKNFAASLHIKSDARSAVQSLLTHPEIKSRPQNQARLDSLAKAHAEVRRDQRAHNAVAEKNERVGPTLFFESLQKVFGADAVYATDSGNGTFIAMELLRLSHAHSFMGPVDYSCMGYAVPAAIGAKMASPNRPVVALAGDGAFLMTGMELVTAATYGIGVVCCILNDGELSQIAQFQRRTLNREMCTRLRGLNYASLADAVGCEFVALENNDSVEAGLKKAYELSQAGKPVLVDVKIDYSLETYFTKGVVKTNFLRFGWMDRFRLVGRVIGRKIF